MQYIPFKMPTLSLRGTKQLRGTLAWLFAFVLSFSVLAQQPMPITGSLQINSPYPATWSEYAATGVSRMGLNLTLNDAEVGSMNVRLKLYIERNNTLIATSSDVVTGVPTLNLVPFITKQLGALDLNPYFRFENLQGFSTPQYQQPLEDGVYRISFQVVNATTGQRLSDMIGQSMFITLNDPPQLTQPIQGEQVAVSGTTLTFQWVSRATTALPIQYDWKVIEVPVGTTNVEALWATAPILYQATTVTNSLPRLMKDFQDTKTYAWRVQAKLSTGMSLFRNNGFSETFTFQMGSTCLPVSGLLLTPKASDVIAISWTGATIYYNYRVAYRKYSTTTVWEWVEQPTTNGYLNLTGLEASTEYEVKIGGVCANGATGFSAPLRATTLPLGQIQGLNCGQMPALPAVGTPIASLAVGDVITAGDFLVTLTKVAGGSGNFSGEGWVKIPWMGSTKIKVIFSGIGVNTDKKLTTGFLQTAYDPNFGNLIDGDEALKNILATVNNLQTLLQQLQSLIASGNQAAIEAWLNANRNSLNNGLSSVVTNGNSGFKGGVSATDSTLLSNTLKGSSPLNLALLSSSLVNSQALLSQFLRKTANELSAVMPSEFTTTTTAVQTQYWVTPVGAPIKLPTGATIEEFLYCFAGVEFDLPQGILKGFLWNGTKYAARISQEGSNSLIFLGYVKYDKYLAPTEADWFRQPTTEGYIPETSLVNIVEYVRNRETYAVSKRTISTAKIRNLSNKALDFCIGARIDNMREALVYTEKPVIVTEGAMTCECSKGEGTLAQYIKNDMLKKFLAGHGKSEAAILFYNCDNDKALYKVTSTGTTALSTNVSIQDAENSVFADNTATSPKYVLRVCITKKGQWSVAVKFKQGALKSKLAKVTEAQAESEINKTIERIQKASNDLGGNMPKYGFPPEQAKDADGLDMGEMYAESGGLVEVVTEVVEAGKSIVNEAKMPEKYWKKGETDAEKDFYNKSMIHLPPFMGGVGDGVIDEVTGKLQLLQMGLSLVENPGQIKQAWNNSIKGLSNLKFADVKESLKEQVAEIANGTDKGLHQGGIVITQLGSTFIGGVAGSMLLEDLVKRAKKVLNLKILKKRVQNQLNVSKWVDRLHPHFDEDLIKRIDNIALNDPAKLGKLDEFYSSRSFSKPADQYIISTSPDGSFLAKTRDGLNDIHFDKNGFPDFEQHSPGKSYFYTSNDLKGNVTTTDFTKANAELGLNFPGKVRPSGQKIEILDGNGNWVEHTWHHHQDGKTLIPVKTSVHSKITHTGGNSVILKDLQGLFDSP